MEIGGESWLIPVDAELLSDSDAENEATPLKSAVALPIPHGRPRAKVCHWRLANPASRTRIEPGLGDPRCLPQQSVYPNLGFTTVSLRLVARRAYCEASRRPRSLG
jgi:hypothetical protein